MYTNGKKHIEKCFNGLNLILTKLRKKKKNQQIQLLFDVSAISRYDMRSGIERVARAQLMGLIAIAPEWVSVVPVRLCEDGEPHFCYARNFAATLEGKKAENQDEPKVEASEGDLFFSSDFYRDATVQAVESGVFDEWKKVGVRVGYFVHDLLPLSNPEYFPEGTDTSHLRWLRSIVSVSDLLITNSQVVASALEEWISQDPMVTVKKGLHIEAVHLGFDIEASLPSRGTLAESATLMQQLEERDTLLMVGTIEPRKGHLQMLKAFDILLERGINLNLLIVGSEGWKGLPHEQRRTIPETMQHITSHHALGQQLFWLEGISDELLQKLYNTTTVLVAASEAEGFGIPLVEAAHHSLPIIARDIPVFREVASSHAYFFKDSKKPQDLADAIEKWLKLFWQDKQIPSEGMPCMSWRKSSQNLLNAYNHSGSSD